MHLGRTPSRLPPDLSASELGPAAAWRRAVDTAIDRGVQAVLLAGDLVDREDDFFEAYRALEAGVRRLTEAGIEVIGVAGNHDVRVLPRLAGHIPQFRLLGAGGTWESCELADGGETVALWGWSFPHAGVAASPLQDTRFDPARGVNLGLLHCDRDGSPNSPYAPVASGELDRAGLDGWLLGHIHKSDALTAAAPNGYLGSLTGLDRGEPGPHGPWLITVAGGRIAAVEHLPLAPLRWEALDVDLGGISEPVETKDRLLAAVRELDGRMTSFPSVPAAVGLSVAVKGRTRFGSAALDEISQEDRNEIHVGSASTHYFIQQIRVDTWPEIDLEELAKRADPVGLLAARLLWLDRPAGDAERDRLVGLARRRLREQSEKAVWHGVETAVSAPEPVTWLRQAGLRALDRLLGQLPDNRDTE